MPDEMSDLDASIKETLDEIEAEGGVEIKNDPRPQATKPPVAEPKPAKEEEAVEKPEPNPAKEPAKEPAKDTKAPSMMPRYEHAIAEKRWEKEKAEIEDKYQKEIEELRKGLQKAETPSEIKQATEDFNALADEIGADPVVVEKIIKAARRGYELPEGIKTLLDRLPDIEKLASQSKEQSAEAQFIQEFDKDVRPLVEAEYGTVSEEQMSDIREKVKRVLTEDPRLVKAPLSFIYNGSSSFRGIVKGTTHTAEKSRGGTARQTTIDFENMTDEQFDALTDEQQDQYAEYHGNKKR